MIKVTEAHSERQVYINPFSVQAVEDVAAGTLCRIQLTTGRRIEVEEDCAAVVKQIELSQLGAMGAAVYAEMQEDGIEQSGDADSAEG